MNPAPSFSLWCIYINYSEKMNKNIIIGFISNKKVLGEP